LPDALVTGVAPASPAACSALVARSRIGPTSARSWGEADLAGAGQPGFGVLAEPVADRLVQLGDAGQQGGEQLYLGADELGEHGRVEPDGRRGSRPEPLQKLGGVAASTVGVAAAERGQPGLGELGGGLWGRELGQERQSDLGGEPTEDVLGAGPVGVQQRAELVAGGGLGRDVVVAQPHQGLQLAGHRVGWFQPA
jgi:hypothetical protein